MRAHNTHTHTRTPAPIHSTYKICIPKGGWVSVTLLNVSWGLYNKCLAEFCQIRSGGAGVYLSPEQAWLETLFPSSSPESASSRLPPVDGVTPICFLCLFPDMRSAATGTYLAIGNIGVGIAGHLGYCHRKHLISYCLPPKNHFPNIVRAWLLHQTRLLLSLFPLLFNGLEKQIALFSCWGRWKSFSPIIISLNFTVDVLFFSVTPSLVLLQNAWHPTQVTVKAVRVSHLNFSWSFCSVLLCPHRWIIW